MQSNSASKTTCAQVGPVLLKWFRSDEGGEIKLRRYDPSRQIEFLGLWSELVDRCNSTVFALKLLGSGYLSKWKVQQFKANDSVNIVRIPQTEDRCTFQLEGECSPGKLLGTRQPTS